MNEPPFQAVLLRLGRSDKNELVKDGVLPSLSSPLTKVSSFQVKNERLKEGNPVCDLSVKGVVDWEWWGIWPDGEKAVERGAVFVNHADKPTAIFDVKFDASQTNGFLGEFAVELQDLPVTSGNNVFKFAISDRIFGIEGNTSWAVSFDVPDDDEDDDDEEGKQRQRVAPVTAGKPELVEEGSAGEIFLYTLVFKGFPTSDVSKVVVTLGNERALSCHLTAQNTNGWHFIKRPYAEVPLFFVFRPSYSAEAARGDLARHMRSVRTLPGKDLPAREAFMAAYSSGVFFHGGDVVAGDGLIAEGVVKLLPDSGALVLHGHVSVDQAPLKDFNLPLPSRFEAAGFTEEKPMVLRELMWRLAKLHRDGDTRTNEIALCMLLGDYTDVGLPDAKFPGWRGELLQMSSDLLSETFEHRKSQSPSEQGFWIGRCVGECLRIAMKPNGPCPLYETSKSKFLSKLLETSLLKEESPSSAKPSSLMDTLRAIFGK